MPDEEQHHIEVQKVFTTRENVGYKAFCSCGYESRVFERPIHAEEDGDDHVLGMVGH